MAWLMFRGGNKVAPLEVIAAPQKVSKYSILDYEEEKGPSREVIANLLLPKNFGSKTGIDKSKQGTQVKVIALIDCEQYASLGKDVFLHLTIIFSVFLAVVLITDIVALFVYESCSMFYEYNQSILVNGNECGHVRRFYLSIGFGALSWIVLIGRAVFEFNYRKYMP
ncbi:hypothetical protein ROZALSC1DRAFT_24174 [Rozella allomycis CSF55]|uniref:Uncharacterized protein n=1 Tax=Rozella allomycis (strain CSF55) TaxID=988480 RepID=A0A4P9YEW9_ROZAC|nr:hypothetical protein ROZALSC1DRAFT_24174 [Rozella allomycis CSF55]